MHISTKCSVALHCLIFIYEYGEKTRVTSDLLSKSTGINAATIRNIFRALKKEDIITVKAGTEGRSLTVLRMRSVCTEYAELWSLSFSPS